MCGGEVQRDVGGAVRAGLLVPAELAVADRVADEIRVDAGRVVTVVLSLKIEKGKTIFTTQSLFFFRNSIILCLLLLMKKTISFLAFRRKPELHAYYLARVFPTFA